MVQIVSHSECRRQPPGDNPPGSAYLGDPHHLAHFQAVRRQIRVICKRETHGLAFISIWLIYLKLEIGKHFLIC